MTDEKTKILETVNVNIAFEHMVFAVLTGAGVAGALTFMLSVGSAVIGGAFSFSVLLSAFLETLLASFMVFLVGFFASVMIGAPLFVMLEKSKRRNAWPYLAAALAVALIVFSFMTGHLPLAEDFNIAVVASIFIPAIVIALTFARSMKPYWLAAAREEEIAQNIFRIH